MDAKLRFKAALVGTPIEPIAMAARRLLTLPKRIAHPELHGIHNEETLLPQILSRTLTRGSNTVDVGCHIGSFISMARKYAPEGKHVGIEPSPSKHAMLANKFKAVTFFQAAVGDSERVAMFEENLDRPGCSKLKGEEKTKFATNTYEVNVRRLDDLISHHVDLMKIDVEGHEIFALRGAQSLIANSKPVIIFERGSEYETEKTPRIELYHFINDTLGYGIHTFKGFLSKSPPLSFDQFEQCGLYPFTAFNFVATPN